MADCKACGEWFSSATDQDLCAVCERALKRLGECVAPVVRCKDCKYHDLGQEPRRCESLGYCILMGAMTPDEGFCYLAKRRR